MRCGAEEPGRGCGFTDDRGQRGRYCQVISPLMMQCRGVNVELSNRAQGRRQSAGVSSIVGDQGEVPATPALKEHIATVPRFRQNRLEQGSCSRAVPLAKGHDSKVIFGHELVPPQICLQVECPGGDQQRFGFREIAGILRIHAQEEGGSPLGADVSGCFGQEPSLLR